MKGDTPPRGSQASTPRLRIKQKLFPNPLRQAEDTEVNHHDVAVHEPTIIVLHYTAERDCVVSLFKGILTD